MDFEKSDISLSSEVIEQLSRQLGEEVGEVSERFEPTPEEEKILEDMLQNTVMQWIEECKINANCWGIFDVDCIEPEVG